MFCVPKLREMAFVSEQMTLNDVYLWPGDYDRTNGLHGSVKQLWKITVQCATHTGGDTAEQACLLGIALTATSRTFR